MRSLILLVIVAAAVAVPRSPQRVMGGEPTTIEEYPYMANMQLGWVGGVWRQQCGGVLITSMTIMSAARCYYRDPPSSWRARLGATLTNEGGTMFDVSNIKLNPGFDIETHTDDLAIVFLSSAATFSDQIGVARIAGPNYILPDGTLATTIGYGSHTPGGDSATQLHHVDVNLINQELCAERYAYLQTLPGHYWTPAVTSGMICTGILNLGGKDACNRDFGGPVVHNGDIVIGVVSWGQSCGDAFYPRVNTRVSSYSEWIAEEGSP